MCARIFETAGNLKNLDQSRIYIVKFWTRVPAWGSNSLNFLQFLGILQNRMLASPRGLALPPRGNPGSATDNVTPCFLTRMLACLRQAVLSWPTFRCKNTYKVLNGISKDKIYSAVFYFKIPSQKQKSKCFLYQTVSETLFRNFPQKSLKPVVYVQDKRGRPCNPFLIWFVIRNCTLVQPKGFMIHLNHCGHPNSFG